jgi:hypothetical protein
MISFGMLLKTGQDKPAGSPSSARRQPSPAVQPICSAGAAQTPDCDRWADRTRIGREMSWTASLDESPLRVVALPEFLGSS